MYKFVYVSHPFGGDSKNREIAREKIATGLKNMGCPTDIVIVNPLDNFIGIDGVYDEKIILRQCIALMRRCDYVVFCGAWKKSRGCRLEHYIAAKDNMKFIEE